MRISTQLYVRTYYFLHQLRRFWITNFWTVPNNLWALKVTIALALMVIPCCILGSPFVGCTLGLGAVGAALGESDDHPRGRRRSLLVTILSFLLVSLLAELLHPYHWVFGACMAVVVFLLILLGGLGSRYQGITFGSLLVFLYAMLGLGIKPWYYQPVLLPLGGLIYGSISLLLLYIRPYRHLKEQLAIGYTSLGNYLHTKSTMFPCTKNEYREIQPELAGKNVAVGEGIDKFKDVLYNCLGVLEGRPLDGLKPYYRQWIILQQLHERATSTHQRYDVLSRRCRNPRLLEGMGQYLQVQAKTLKLFGKTILSGAPFHIPNSLPWIRETVGCELENSKNDPEYVSLNLLYKNLERITELLQSLQEAKENLTVPFDRLQYKPTPLKTRLKHLLRAGNLRFRHAVRLSVCMLIGYALMVGFHLDKGTWILLTAVFVCQRDYVSTRRRLSQRILGTFIGVLLSAFFARIMPSLEGQIVVTLLAVYAFFYWVKQRYTVAVIFITIFVSASFNLQGGFSANVLWLRMLYTMIGSFLAFLTVRFLWPDWQYHHIPQLLDDAINKTGRYFHTIYATNIRGAVYYHNRRTAHHADNALAMAWSGMRVEPRNKRHLQRKAYTLTNLHHALLSYVSALGAHNYGYELSEKEVQVCKTISKIINQARYNLHPFGAEFGENITLDEAKQWNLHLKQKLSNTHQHNLIILYNISLTATELLKESEDKEIQIRK